MRGGESIVGSGYVTPKQSNRGRSVLSVGNLGVASPM